jgi:hypothetical protein
MIIGRIAGFLEVCLLTAIGVIITVGEAFL